MSHFFAYLDRMRLIHRWGLMRNTRAENDMEHSLQTAFIAHGLAVLAANRYAKPVNPERVAVLAMYHDASEVITGDLPTPVKYRNPLIQKAYGDLEQSAREKLVHMLPNDLQGGYAPYLQPNEQEPEWALVKAADRISAYLKCLEEEQMGNRDFLQAKETIWASIQKTDLPEVRDFLETFLPSFRLSPDELSRTE